MEKRNNLMVVVKGKGGSCDFIARVRNYTDTEVFELENKYELTKKIAQEEKTLLYQEIESLKNQINELKGQIRVLMGEDDNEIQENN